MSPGTSRLPHRCSRKSIFKIKARLVQIEAILRLPPLISRDGRSECESDQPECVGNPGLSCRGTRSFYGAGGEEGAHVARSDGCWRPRRAPIPARCRESADRRAISGSRSTRPPRRYGRRPSAAAPSTPCRCSKAYRTRDRRRCASYLLGGGVPIGADWDPTKLSFPRILYQMALKNAAHAYVHQRITPARLGQKIIVISRAELHSANKYSRSSAARLPTAAPASRVAAASRPFLSCNSMIRSSTVSAAISL
jgi:hypothetical protein